MGDCAAPFGQDGLETLGVGVAGPRIGLDAFAPGLFPVEAQQGVLAGPAAR